MREIKTRLGGQWTGVVWLLGEPLLHMGIMIIMRVVLRQMTTRAGYDATIYLLVSLLPFLLFSNSWTQVMNAMRANYPLFAYKQVKPFDAAIARIIVEVSIKFGVYFIAFLICGRLGLMPVIPADFLGYILVVFVFLAMGLSLGLMSAVVTHYIPKAGLVISLVSMPLYMCSGVVMRVESFGPGIKDYLMWNPLLHLVELARYYFLPGYPVISGTGWGYPLRWAVVLAFFAMVLYWFNRRTLASPR